jgi:hypothetical protein
MSRGQRSNSPIRLNRESLILYGGFGVAKRAGRLALVQMVVAPDFTRGG